MDIGQTEKQIHEIEDIFHSFELKGSSRHLLRLLAQFEHRTSSHFEIPHLAAVIRWHKNLFLQKTGYFPRAEQLLDEALDLLEDRAEPIFNRWKLKIYISLGYVHLAQWNYLDAESYLKDALEMALSIPPLFKFLGEIYSLLGSANLSLGRHTQAKRFVALEMEKCRENYTAKSIDDGLANIYAYALVNYSRVNRMVELMDHRVMDYLTESIDLFSRLQNPKGLHLARLEMAEFLFLINRVDRALEIALSLEPIFKEKQMERELLQAGLLAAKIHGKMLDFERAETKLQNQIELAKNQTLEYDRIISDLFHELGSVYNAIDEEAKAIQCFRESARIGMVLGIKNIIIRAFNACRSIDRHKAKELLTSDLVYEEALFVRNRLRRNISPFKESRAKAKLFASTLFVDIVDFSRMMRKSDEDLTVRMIDELVDRMYLIIYRHNGYIDKFLGDGFMVIFEHGYSLQPATAFNAIKAGLDIHRALKHKNRKLRRVYSADENIRVRIGISTGEIFAMQLGNYIKTEFTYLGNSVNLASKLESQASNQMMLIDTQTFELVKDRILSDPDRIVIPGLGETTAYRVLRLIRMRDRSNGNIESAASPVEPVSSANPSSPD